MALFRAILLAALIPVVTTTIFTSSHKVREMVLQEDKILSRLKDYIEKQQDHLKEVSDKYQKLLEESRQKTKSEVISDLDHPNGAYYAIKRFSVHYPKVLGRSLHLVTQRRRVDAAPITLADNNDFEGALSAIIRLQEIYNLSTSDMIEGNYRGHMGPALGFDDVYFIGRTAFTMGKLKISRDWLERSLELRQKDPATASSPHRQPTVGAIKSLTGRVYVLLGNLRKAEELYKEARKDDRKHGDVIVLAKELKTVPEFSQPHRTREQANYSRLCQYKGPYHIESPDYKAMKCRYKAALVPYYAFREEILSVSPYVSLYYNIFTDEEQTHMRENVYDTLQRGEIGSGFGDDKARSSDIRTSDVAWLRDADNPRTALISRRVGLVTGLSVQQDPTFVARDFPQSGEDLQVVNYGLAGHYDVHMDPFDTPDASGFRIATFLIYLSPVAEGGNTVFTRAGISVAPEKDTVLFWYSFSPSFNKIDRLTYHAGCPVIIGEKWIANKWVRSHGNDYSRPCGLKPDYTQLDIEKVMELQKRKMFMNNSPKLF